MKLIDFTEMKTFSGLDLIKGGFRVVFDNNVYELTEDESDGYRSYLNDVIQTNKKVDNIFNPIDVFCVYRADSYYNIVEVYDKNNHKKILVFGTQNLDDYYPYCVLDWYPQNLSFNEGVNV